MINCRSPAVNNFRQRMKAYGAATVEMRTLNDFDTT